MRSGIPSGSLPLCSTSTGVLPARPVRWRTSRRGCSARGRSTCGGTTWRPSPTAGTRSSTTGRWRSWWSRRIRGGRYGTPGWAGSRMRRTGCRGYKKCVEQCPYKKPMYRGTTRVSEKCIACYPRVEGKDPLTGGEPMETRCMAACVGKIRLQSLVKIGEDGLWAEDRWHPLYYTIRVEQVALPLYPQWGTEPNGFYIPPRHSPRGYIRQMFGPGVDNAIGRYMLLSRDLMGVL